MNPNSIMEVNTDSVEHPTEPEKAQIQELMGALLKVPGVCEVIVWTEEDARRADVPADSVDWNKVAQRGIEAGWDVVHAQW